MHPSRTLTYKNARAGPYAGHHTGMHAVGPAPQFLPPDPQGMLIQQRAHPLRWMVHPFFILFLALLAVEAFAPTALKPSYHIGEAGGRVIGGIMQATNEKELDLAEQLPYADALGERERMRSNFTGLCAASGVLDRQLAAYCFAMTNEYFRHALPPARAYRDRYRGHLR